MMPSDQVRVVDERRIKKVSSVFENRDTIRAHRNTRTRYAGKPRQDAAVVRIHRKRLAESSRHPACRFGRDGPIDLRTDPELNCEVVREVDKGGLYQHSLSVSGETNCTKLSGLFGIRKRTCGKGLGT